MNKVLSKNSGILKSHKGIIVIILIFALVRMYFIFTRFHMPIWDEGVYLGMGKYIFSLGNAGLWESIRPIGLPLFTGFVWFLDLDQVVWSQIVILLFSIGTIIITYIIANKLFNKITAITSAVLLAVFPVFFFNTGMILTEIPSTFFVMLATYYFIKKSYVNVGIFLGLTFLFKFPHAIFLLSLATVVLLYKGDINKKIIAGTKIGIAFIITTLPFFILNFLLYRNYTKNAFDAIFRPILLGSLHQNNIFQGVIDGSLMSYIYNLTYYIIIILKNNPLIVLSIIACIYIISKKKLRQHLSILAIPTLVYLIYFTAIINKQDRFLILFLPLLCILTAYYINNWMKSINNKYPWYAALLSACIILIVALNITTDINYYYLGQSQIPPIVDTLYTYFDSNNVNGMILTTDPLFSVFSDKRYLPFYETARNDSYLNEWEKFYDIKAVVYSESAFPCFDDDCRLIRKKSFDDITMNYKLKDTIVIGENTYYMFIK